MYEAPPVPVNIALWPAQIVALLLPIVGKGKTVSVVVPVVLQPLASVTVTVYAVVAVTVGVMVAVVAPVLQE